MKKRIRSFGIPLSVVGLTGLLLCACASTTTPVSTISPDSAVLTMINVLTPAPGKQQETLNLLQKAMDSTMRHQQGFISAIIHRSMDSEHVVVYAQWENQASVEGVIQLVQQGEAPDLAEAFTIASPDFHPYEVVSIHSTVR